MAFIIIWIIFANSEDLVCGLVIIIYWIIWTKWSGLFWTGSIKLINEALRVCSYTYQPIGRGDICNSMKVEADIALFIQWCILCTGRWWISALHCCLKGSTWTHASTRVLYSRVTFTWFCVRFMLSISRRLRAWNWDQLCCLLYNLRGSLWGMGLIRYHGD